MSTHKNIDRICVVITVFSLLITVLFINGKSLGISAATRSMGYESTLFDTTCVHTIDIIIDDWDSFIETATSEDYTACTVVIDNDAVRNVAIRGKGNTSLSTVSSMGSERYSFKIEFDHYQSGKSYKGLDKLCLNNIIQDYTYMKDYLTYRMMTEFGVDAPLCSYVWVTVNGEDWGLYLAVEAIEDSFMARVYSNEGDLYKPDSFSMGGGGPGNGRDFNIDDFMNENADAMGWPWSRNSDNDIDTDQPQVRSDRENSQELMPQPSDNGTDNQTETPGQNTESPDNQPVFPGTPSGGGMTPPDMSDGIGGVSGRAGSGMGSDDVKLQYIDDDPDSYSNIFDNSKTAVTDLDKARLIRSLKSLSEGESLEDVLDIDEVLRYFVVHNFTVNGDSYTGSMIHNYYLHESDGELSMIPWDYNLAFGTFQNSSASDAVNDPIDTPLSVGGDGSRPMADWIFVNEEYTELYHQYFAEFLNSIDAETIINETYALIAGYVEKDPTAFCSYEEFETAVQTLRIFCEKRTESILGQLDGTIPTTDAGQSEDAYALIDASDITLSSMGSMGGGNGNPGGAFGGDPRNNTSGEGAWSGKMGDNIPGLSQTQNTEPDSEKPTLPDNESGAFPQQNNDGGFERPKRTDNGTGFSSGRMEPASEEADRVPNAGSMSISEKNSWIMVGASALILVIAILIAKKYKKD